MSDMYKSGQAAFNGWRGNSREFWSRFLGDFNAKMTAEEANKILHEGKLTQVAQYDFIRGWRQAQKDFVA